MPFIGELAALGTSLCFSFGSTLFTLSGREVGSLLVNRFRLLVALLLVMLLHLVSYGQLIPLDAGSDRWFWLGVSGFVGLVLGDAFCGFNPIYGQGMSVAAMSAVALADGVRRSHGNLDGVAKSTLRQIGGITRAIWFLATSADLEWPGTQGGAVGNSLLDRLGRRYVSEMLDAMYFDPAIRRQFFAVNQLIKPGTALFAPGIFLRVMKHILWRKRRQSS